MIEPGAAAVRPALARLADTLEVRPFPLALGGNVFGWTADEAASFEVLDGFVAGGGTLVDTADGYSHWAPGHTGGESETLARRAFRPRRARHREQGEHAPGVRGPRGGEPPSGGVGHRHNSGTSRRSGHRGIGEAASRR
ncbi:hypothetical protein [Agromyces mediolanus]|uniref:hypothetical protein n=1 Tax=Agromyces mediolanus TaxID=41986 RepID=UPI003F762A4C